MAKQKGPVFITGSKGDYCFYEMEGEYYVRRKSTLSGKRVKKDPAFAQTMVYAGRMAQASQIAVAVYRALPVEKRKHALYRAMTGTAMQLLKTGMDLELIKARLEADYVKVEAPKADNKKRPAKAPRVVAQWRKYQQRQGIRVGNIYVTGAGLLRGIDVRILEKKMDIHFETESKALVT